MLEPKERFNEFYRSIVELECLSKVYVTCSPASFVEERDPQTRRREFTFRARPQSVPETLASVVVVPCLSLLA